MMMVVLMHINMLYEYAYVKANAMALGTTHGLYSIG